MVVLRCTRGGRDDETPLASTHPKVKRTPGALSEVTPTVPAMDPRANGVPGRVDEHLELTYLHAGAEPPWERPHRDGVDVTDRPDLQTPYQRQRCAAYVSRVEEYRERGLI